MIVRHVRVRLSIHRRSRKIFATIAADGGDGTLAMPAFSGADGCRSSARTLADPWCAPAASCQSAQPVSPCGRIKCPKFLQCALFFSTGQNTVLWGIYKTHLAPDLLHHA
ncbi:hypothetical protein KL936_003672 [Ogataea polymorpha]|nr:hypothetical protein KL936_003672 [Ogataea polymorpha]KAG7916129.1 hypothetical protein KL927_003594 [Ogataea polymorpha]